MFINKLKNEKFRFCLIQSKSKIPFEQKWQSENNYIFDDDILIKHIEAGGNYGIIGGYGNLLVIDFDNKEFQDKYLPLLPPTLMVKTGSGGMHLYYYCDDCTSMKVLDDKKNTLADIQGRGKQVVAPGSIHPNGNRYEIINDLPINNIKISNLKILFNKYMNKNNKYINKYDDDSIIEKIKFRLSLSTVLSHYNYDLSRNPTMCKLGHSSKGGKCFSWSDTDNLWYCHHCGQGGDIISLVMAQEGWDFPTAKEHLRKTAGIEKVINNNSNISSLTIPELRQQILDIIFDDSIKDKDDIISEIIVKFILSNKKIKTIRSDEKAETWIYNDGIYIPEGKTYIKELVRDILGKTYKPTRINRIIQKIESDTYIDSDKFFVEEDINLVAVNNGILNLKTRELIKFSNQYKFFNKLPVNFDPSKNCEKIIKFFSEITHDKSDLDTLQEMFGFLLYRNYEVEKAIMFNGNGRNGKSKTIEIMKLFIGVKNCANVPIQSLEKDLFSMGELLNKLANLAADISKTALEETGKFKSLIGRDLVSAPRKFLPMVHFQNYAKMIFSANELPVTNDLSDAFWNRWVIIDFPYTFVSQKEYEKAEERTKLRIANPIIVKEITSKEQLSGLLNWALDGLVRLLNQGDFSSNKSSLEVKNTWLRRSSSIHAFIMDCVVRKSDSKIPKFEFLEAYLEYCSKHKITSVNEKIIKNTLETTVGSIEYRPSIDGERVTCWKGIMLK